MRELKDNVNQELRSVSEEIKNLTDGVLKLLRWVISGFIGLFGTVIIFFAAVVAILLIKDSNKNFRGNVGTTQLQIDSPLLPPQSQNPEQR